MNNSYDPHKPTYQRNIIRKLQVTADYNFQRGCLDNPDGGWVWIYYETYQRLFEDNTLIETWQDGEWMFSPEIDREIAKLAPELKKIDGRLMEDVIIDLPQMQVLREKAAAILAMLGEPPVFPY